MRRVLLGVAVLALGLGLVVWLFRGPIAIRVMSIALERNMPADPIGELPDGLHVTLCGAGGPLPDQLRSGPCVAVVAAQRVFRSGRMHVPVG